MSEMTGVVQEVKSKPVAGGKTAYDIVVAGQAYGVGLYAPKCKVGDYVKFEIDDSRGYKNVARNSLKVSANKPPAEAVAEAQATAPKVSTTGGSFDTKQDTISRQSAANTAVAFMGLLSANEALGLPKADAKGQRQAAMEALLDKYTQYFYEHNTGVAYKSIAPTGADAEVDGPEVEEEEVAAPATDEWQ